MAQTGLPIADDVRTGWVDHADGTTNLFQKIDETQAGFSDADYVKSPTPPGTNEYEAGLTASLVDPVSSTNHIMRWRRRAPVASGATINLTVRLLQATTQITSQADNSLPSSFTNTSYTLSGAEADSITDYTVLNVEFVAAQV
jgi:hypothetical protein